MPDRPHLCVFCGSATGKQPEYTEAAQRVGRALARNGIGLVYGGGGIGLMGVAADAALAEGGRVVGVIPDPLATKEVAHAGLSELHIVPGMHERKALMAKLSRAFLTLPGGIGTFEEFFEILTWAALGIHHKPLGLLNVGGYFNPLLAMLEHAVAEGFVRPEHRALVLVSEQPEALAIDLIRRRPPSTGPEWVNIEQS